MPNVAFFLLLINALSAVFVLFRELARNGGYLTLPFHISLIFLTWFIPQVWALQYFAALSPVDLSRLLMMSLFCFWAMVVGWNQGLKGWVRPARLNLDSRKLVSAAYLITIISIAMRVLIEMQPPEVRAGGQWTGGITIIAFFASLGVISLAISAALIFEHRSTATIFLFSLNIGIYFPLMFMYFRRAEVFEFGMSILLALFFIGKRTVPRLFLIAMGVLGFFLLNGVGQLRDLGGGYRVAKSGAIEARVPSLSEISEIDWLAVIDPAEAAYRSEAMNAVVGMAVVSENGSFTFGAQFWNSLVFSYVPGQIVGYEFKDSLMLGESALQIASERKFFEVYTGTTTTGFLQPYQDFWIFGFLVWWLTGYVMGITMRHALKGNMTAYILYAATISNAVHVATHSGYYLFSQSLLIGIAIMLIWLSHQRSVPRIHRNF